MKTQTVQEKQNAYYNKSGSSVSNTYEIDYTTNQDIPEQINVLCVYLTNITLSGAPSATDGITPVHGSTVLVDGQTDKKQNGIYTVNTSGAWSRVYTLKTVFICICT